MLIYIRCHLPLLRGIDMYPNIIKHATTGDAIREAYETARQLKLNEVGAGVIEKAKELGQESVDPDKLISNALSPKTDWGKIIGGTALGLGALGVIAGGKGSRKMVQSVKGLPGAIAAPATGTVGAANKAKAVAKTQRQLLRELRRPGGTLTYAQSRFLEGIR
jgi:hypothetical protein